MGPLALALGALGAAGLGWFALKPKPRYLGDLVVPGKGAIQDCDQVEVLVSDLMKANASVQIGTGAGQLPPGTTTVIVAATGGNKDTLQGPITAVGQVPLPTPLGSMIVPRSDVQKIYRIRSGGQKPLVATQESFAQHHGIFDKSDAAFAGERARYNRDRFVG